MNRSILRLVAASASGQVETVVLPRLPSSHLRRSSQSKFEVWRPPVKRAGTLIFPIHCEFNSPLLESRGASEMLRHSTVTGMGLDGSMQGSVIQR
jgi:hypothetical protein